MTVVDASVAVKWFIAGEPGHDAARELLEHDPVLLAPDLLLVEAANVAWRKVRLGELSEGQATSMVAALGSGDISLVASSGLVLKALSLTTELEHPVYDCLYLALALDRQTTLVTADERFHRRLADSAHAVAIELLV